MERARMIGQGIFTSMETVQLYMPAVCCGDQRDLIVRIAVAVGILLFEGFQHFVVLIDSGWSPKLSSRVLLMYIFWE